MGGSTRIGYGLGSRKGAGNGLEIKNVRKSKRRKREVPTEVIPKQFQAEARLHDGWEKYEVTVFADAIEMEATLRNRTFEKGDRRYLAWGVRVEQLDEYRLYDWRIEYCDVNSQVVGNSRKCTLIERSKPLEAIEFLDGWRPDFIEGLLGKKVARHSVYVAPSPSGGTS